MFLEIRVMSCIEKLKDTLKDIRSFEDPLKKSTSAGKRAKSQLIEVERDIIAIRREIMEIRRNRVATGGKKKL